MGKHIMYECPKCHARNKYNGTKDVGTGNYRTHCPHCHKLIYVKPIFFDTNLNIQRKFHKNLKNRKNPKKPITDKKTTTKKPTIQTMKNLSQKSKSDKNQKSRENIPVNPEVPSYERDLNPDPSHIFRNHSYRFKVSLKFLPKTFRWDENRTIKMKGGWFKKFRLFQSIDLEAHLNCIQECLILNFVKDLWLDIPDNGDIALNYAEEFVRFLQVKHNIQIHNDLCLIDERKSPHAAADVTNDPDFKNMPSYYEVENTLGAISYDNSRDKDGVRHAEFEPKGKRLIDRLKIMPYEIDEIYNIIKKLLENDTNLQNRISELIELKKLPEKDTKIKKKDDNYDSLYI